MKAIVATACLLLTIDTGVLRAAPGDVYVNVLERYPSDPEQAIRNVLELSRAVIVEGVELCDRVIGQAMEVHDGPGRLYSVLRCSPQQRLAGAMMHADAAASVIDEEPNVAGVHIDAARRLLQALRPGVRIHAMPDDLTVFIGSWYAYVVRLLIGYHLIRPATTALAEGLTISNRSPDLLLARAVLAAHIVHEYPSFNYMLRTGIAGLQSPSVHYQQALRMDPHHAPTLLHLAAFRMSEGDRKVGPQFTAALAETDDADLKYVGHLLRGTAAERNKQLPDAIADYEAAHRDGPSYQVACVALIAAHSAAGEVERSADVVDECPALSSEEKLDDPWWGFQAGEMESSTIGWLRTRARQSGSDE